MRSSGRESEAATYPKSVLRPTPANSSAEVLCQANMLMGVHTAPPLQSPFLCCALKFSSLTATSSLKAARSNQLSATSYPRIRAVDLDQNTIVAISVGLVSVAVGIGIPVFYETQIDNAAKRENTQPCFPCDGSGSQRCRFCMGTGSVTVELGGDEKEVSRCVNCEGLGSLICTTCQGTGIQPRYLDRREFKDDD